MGIVFFIITFALGVLFGYAAVRNFIERVFTEPSAINIVLTVLLGAISVFMFLETFA